MNDERRWLYAAVDPETNGFPHVRLFPTRATRLTVLFLRELRQIVPVTRAAILVDDAHHLKAALSRLGLRFQMRRHGNRNAVERVPRGVKCRTSSFSNTFSHAQPTTAERWLQAFSVWWNHAQVNTTRTVGRNRPRIFAASGCRNSSGDLHQTVSGPACPLVGLPESLDHPADREVDADLFYHERPARTEPHCPRPEPGGAHRISSAFG